MKNCKEETLLFENFHAFQLNKKLVFYKYRGRLDFFIRRNNQAIQKSNKCFVIILSYSCSLSIFLINSKLVDQLELLDLSNANHGDDEFDARMIIDPIFNKPGKRIKWY